jgi:hypothetical protein
MQVQLVPQTMIDYAWRDGAHQLARACDKSAGDVTPDQLKMLLARGERHLLCFREGADGPPLAWAVITFEQHPNQRALFVYSLFAPGATGDDAIKTLEQFARANGASVLRGACQDASVRLWQRRGFTKAYTIIERNIT